MPARVGTLARHVWRRKLITAGFESYCRSVTIGYFRKLSDMRVAILTTDNREHYKDYANPMPHFGTAPEGLLRGFEGLPNLEIHIVSCTRQGMRSPQKLTENIWFHSLAVPKIGWMRTLYQGCIRAIRFK